VALSYVGYQTADLPKALGLGLGLVTGNDFVQSIFEGSLVGVGICMPLVQYIQFVCELCWHNHVGIGWLVDAFVVKSILGSIPWQ